MLSLLGLELLEESSGVNLNPILDIHRNLLDHLLSELADLFQAIYPDLQLGNVYLPRLPVDLGSPDHLLQHPNLDVPIHHFLMKVSCVSEVLFLVLFELDFELFDVLFTLLNLDHQAVLLVRQIVILPSFLFVLVLDHVVLLGHVHQLGMLIFFLLHHFFHLLLYFFNVLICLCFFLLDEPVVEFLVRLALLGKRLVGLLELVVLVGENVKLVL